MTNSVLFRGWILRVRVDVATAALASVVVIVLGLSTPSARAQTFTVLYNFTGASDGGYPYAGLIQDTAGNLYSTTAWDGPYGYGVVFKVDTSGTETVLYSFTGGLTGDAPKWV
jgi:uncharacterized repeat protein (TIGR03803 family)